MAKIAKILVMIVRLLFLVELVLGVLVVTLHLQFLNPHIGLGFLLAICVALLAFIAFAQRKFGTGIRALIFAVLLPISGFKQFPLHFGSHIGLMQILHVIIALATVGMSEALYSAIRKSTAESARV